MDKYRLVGPAYDTLSKLYSGNAIKESKICMLRPDTVAKGDKVLFVGAGHGADAIRAAELGAEVTIVDISPTMHARFERSLAKHPQARSLNITPILGDILKHENFGHYDIVVCNYFLNVFERKKMLLLLEHIARHCKASGYFILADFKPVEGPWHRKLIQNTYWYAAATSFFVAAGNAIHSIYDYAPLLEDQGFTVVETDNFNVAGVPLYYSIRAEKQA